MWNCISYDKICKCRTGKSGNFVDIIFSFRISRKSQISTGFRKWSLAILKKIKRHILHWKVFLILQQILDTEFWKCLILRLLITTYLKHNWQDIVFAATNFTSLKYTVVTVDGSDFASRVHIICEFNFTKRVA